MAGEFQSGKSVKQDSKNTQTNASALSSLPSLPDDDDLEKYGVWVKSGPEDVIEEEPATDDFTLQDLDVDLDADLEEGDPSLTDEEEKLLEKLEDEIPEEEDIFSDLDTMPAEETAAAIGTDLPFDDELSLDEDLSFDTELPLDEDLSFDTELPLDEELSLDDIPSLDEKELSLEIEAEESPVDEFEEKATEDEELIEIPLEEELDEIQEEEEEEIGELAEASPDIELLEEDEESEISSTLPSAEENLDDIDIDELHQSDYGEELPELELDGEENLFVDEKKTAAPSPAESPESKSKMPSMDMSTSILMKIEEELRTIKDELSSLKLELSSLRTSEIPEKQIPSPDKEKTEPAGFFEEEEDETIALTGDELDNILNTAEITEETGEAEFPEDETLSGTELDNILKSAEITEETTSFGDLMDESHAEDETLTGDELDKILSTAELIEETAEPEIPPDEADFGEDIIPLEKEKTAASRKPSQEEDLSLDDIPSFSLDEELSIPDTIGDEDARPVELTQDEDIRVMEDSAQASVSGQESVPELDLDLEMEAEPPSPIQPPTQRHEVKPLKENELIDEIEIDIPGDLRDTQDIDSDLEPESLDLDLDMESPDEETVNEIDLDEIEPVSLDEESAPGEEETTELAEPEIEIDDSIPEISVNDEDLSFELEPEDNIDFEVGEAEKEDDVGSIAELPATKDIADDAEAVIDTETPEDSDGELSLDDIEIEDDDFDIIAEHEEALTDDDLESLKQDVPVTDEVMERIPDNLKKDLKSVLTYMDQLLESLPEDKIKEFAQSEHFEVYKKLFEELGLT